MRTAPQSCSVAEISRRVQTGVDDPLDAARHALSVIARREPELYAWSYLATVGDLIAPSTRAASGPLAGVPFGVKDIIDVAGMPTRCGSEACNASPSQFDASCVALLRRAGAVPVGKTVTAEFAYVRPGPTRNPANRQHTPGGSSSGSAAAVAAGMVPMALGTQTGGSMIRPAAFCGVVGFKPSFGALARDGMKIMCESLDVIGWYCSDVADVARVAEVMLPDAPLPLYSPEYMRTVKIKFLPGNPCHVLEHAAQAALDDARIALGGLSTIEPVPEITDATRFLEAHSVIMHYELSRSLLPVASEHAPQLSRPLREAIDKGLAMPAQSYREMKTWQHAQRLRWTDYFGDADVVLTSSALGPAPRGLGSTGTAAFNKAWSLLGWPCIHLPTALSEDGLPLGVQLVGKPGTDSELIGWALALHKFVDRRIRAVP
jgi:Asp-tRNA(Asn)/Glu-tRNA(Gln) amidotransferase A subunit family amidase